jgi:hypothetical protein
LIQVNVSENSRTHWKIARLIKARPSTRGDIGGLCLIAGQCDAARANLAIFVALGVDFGSANENAHAKL